jgi:PadR family transcriptional regulator PadR
MQTFRQRLPQHNRCIVYLWKRGLRSLQQINGEVLRVEEGSLYPALQRMLVKGWVVAEWKQSEHNRRARFYQLTPRGRKQLAAEVAEFEKVTGAIRQVIRTA